MYKIPDNIYKKLKFAGEILFQRGLVDTRSGNVSVRLGKNRMIIKKTGENMGFLKKQSFVVVPINGTSPKDKFASSDLEIHRKIYALHNRFNVVLHSHPPEAIALSHVFDEFEPTDYETRAYVKRVRFVEYDKVPEIVSEDRVCVVKFHGIFCAGEDINSALLLNLIVSNSLKIALYEKILGVR